MGTFFVPVLVMTFVYIRIFLETRSRLQERSKQVNKLAKSMANSVRKTPLPNNCDLNRGLSANKETELAPLNEKEQNGMPKIEAESPRGKLYFL